MSGNVRFGLIVSTGGAIETGGVAAKRSHRAAEEGKTNPFKANEKPSPRSENKENRLRESACRCETNPLRHGWRGWREWRRSRRSRGSRDRAFSAPGLSAIIPVARMFIVDAHLDLAYNVDRGRDVTRPAREQPMADNEVATVGLPDLREGNVGLICATIFCSPRRYTTADEARAIAMNQLQWYRRQIDQGAMNFVTTRLQLPKVNETAAGPLRAILLMEGADALRTPADVSEWFEYGLRIVGLAWRRTRAAGGTDEPGPLSDFGRALVREFDRLGIIHDASHLAEEAFWQLMDLASGPVLASHSNCRAIVPTDRQISDDMVKAIANRDGVIGINFYDQFLMQPSEYRTRACTFDDLLMHVNRMCDLIGDAKHVGLGTDLDGGVGRDDIPHEIKTAADLPKLADALSSAGFGDDDIVGIMGGNWIRFFNRALPGA
jgi:membrane dipeptidase